MPIQLLPPRLANQIAAGEVVERPASVVKELVENSLDAGATRIELDIEKGGHKRIRLRDNGNGIPREELELALSRHATSKIATLDDLEQILSLGFRGEALASISSVSRLTLTSKPTEQEQAWQAHCEGREMAVTLNPVAHPDGTTLDVVDLFYNTPARRKFLRTEKTEFQHIEDVFKRIALSHPEVSFTLRHNGKVIKRYAASADNRAQRIGQVMGNAFLDHAVYTECDYDGIYLQAWLGERDAMRSSNDSQYSFVNGRGMRDKLMLHALRQAYESVYGEIEQPAFVVYLSLNPRDVDVNVHPAKHEVRFQQGRLIHDFIVKAVMDALLPRAQEQGAPAFSYEEPRHDYMQPLSPVPSQPSPASGGGYTGAGKSRPSSGSGAANAQYQTNYQALMSANSDTQGESATADNVFMLSTNWRIYRDEGHCWLLSASRILTLWCEQCLTSASASQPLLMPVAVSVESVHSDTLTALQEQGFTIQSGAGKYRLIQVPAGMRHLPWLVLFPSMLEQPLQNISDIALAIASAEVNWDEAILRQTWSWFDQQSQAKQWECIREFGKVRPVPEVIQWWEQ